ncbi:MAG: UDP-N-acetylmuramoyl-L-alanine--D-glutamate ligase [Actinomycetota bacterium]|jgi:UDP-N-acetylmuramoylalanine--D-glutamate ligase|nr:UDP-N-acetylmuramoyl-L-alanine--D-glutamate ligase [Actinomycetota bacterium]
MVTLVYGLGESGISATRALLLDNQAVRVADAGDDDRLQRTLRELGVEGALGAGPEVLDGSDRVVVSPGIRPGDPVLRSAEERGMPVVSEVGLGLQLLGRSGVRVAAVTGTNGKTTVVDMLHRMLDGVPHAVAGNSWRALTGCLDEVREAGLLLLEVSSFQLHYLEGPGFDVAALLNARPDHLNWHASFEEYARDKLRVFEGQGPQDLALVSARDPVGLGVSDDLAAEVLVVGQGETAVRGGRLSLRGQEIASEPELRFAGRHNLENALFAGVAAERLGASVEEIRAGLLGYRLKPHRMEVVAERAGVLYVDDSKATNPAAVAAALTSFDAPVVLILGGSEKETDFAEVLPHLERCRAVVCQGEAGPGIFDYLRAAGCGDACRLVAGLREAVAEAASLAREGDVVLLSPGCASFDQFAGYAERGEEFSRLVAELTGSGVRR